METIARSLSSNTSSKNNSKKKNFKINEAIVKQKNKKAKKKGDRRLRCSQIGSDMPVGPIGPPHSVPLPSHTPPPSCTPRGPMVIAGDPAHTQAQGARALLPH